MGENVSGHRANGLVSAMGRVNVSGSGNDRVTSYLSEHESADALAMEAVNARGYELEK